MRKRGLLVDFENVQKIDLSHLEEDFHVTIFVGNSQNTIPFALIQSMQCLGTRVEWRKVEGNGNNALDFHIAYHLGCCFTLFPTAQYYILSKDSGFDPLIRHLNRQDFQCRRISSLRELKPAQGLALECSSCHQTPPGALPESKAQSCLDANPNYKRVVEALTKMAHKPKPRRRVGLVRHVATLFQKKLPAEEIERLVALLFAEGRVLETDKTLTYFF